MRSTESRLVAVGAVMVVGAVAFALLMLSIASRSTNPAELMRVVGTVSGTVMGLGVAVITAAVLGRKPRAAPLIGTLGTAPRHEA